MLKSIAEGLCYLEEPTFYARNISTNIRRGWCRVSEMLVNYLRKKLPEKVSIIIRDQILDQ